MPTEEMRQQALQIPEGALKKVIFDQEHRIIDEPEQSDSEVSIGFNPLGMRRLARLDQLNEENRRKRQAMGFRNRAHERQVKRSARIKCKRRRA